MGKASRDKGKAGERQLAAELTHYGFPSRRTAQYCGQTGDASDVVGLEGIHIECKRVERLNVHEAIGQAVRDSSDGQKGFPAVFSRRSREEWLVTMPLRFWIELYREYAAGKWLDEQREQEETT